MPVNHPRSRHYGNIIESVRFARQEYDSVPDFPATSANWEILSLSLSAFLWPISGSFVRIVAVHASHVLMFHVPASHRPYGEVFSVFQAARQTVSHKEIPQNGKQHGPHATRTDKCTILGETPHCSGIVSKLRDKLPHSRHGKPNFMNRIIELIPFSSTKFILAHNSVSTSSLLLCERN